MNELTVDKFSLENWYPHLKKHTFKSRFISLGHQDIEYLMGHNPSGYDSIALEAIFNSALAEFDGKEAFMRLSSRSPKDSRFLFDEASNIMSKDEVYLSEEDNKNQQLVSFVVSMLKAMKINSGRKIVDTISQSPRVYNDLLSLLATTAPEKCTTQVILRQWQDIRPE